MNCGGDPLDRPEPPHPLVELGLDERAVDVQLVDPDGLLDVTPDAAGELSQDDDRAIGPAPPSPGLSAWPVGRSRSLDLEQDGSPR